MEPQALSYVGSGFFSISTASASGGQPAETPRPSLESEVFKLTVKKPMTNSRYASRIRLVRAGLSRARRARARVRRQRLLMLKNARSN